VSDLVRLESVIEGCVDGAETTDDVYTSSTSASTKARSPSVFKRFRDTTCLRVDWQPPKAISCTTKHCKPNVTTVGGGIVGLSFAVDVLYQTSRFKRTTSPIFRCGYRRWIYGHSLYKTSFLFAVQWTMKNIIRNNYQFLFIIYSAGTACRLFFDN